MNRASTEPARIDASIVIPFLIFTGVWGSTWIVIRDQIGSVPPQWSVAYRFAIAAIAMALVAKWKGQSLKMDRGGMFAALVLVRLWPCLPNELKLPVIVYVVALAGMAAQAASVWREHPGDATRIAGIGGAFFVASDALLALDRFSAPIPTASVWVLATYWIAQGCIARSVGDEPVSAQERS